MMEGKSLEEKILEEKILREKSLEGRTSGKKPRDGKLRDGKPRDGKPGIFGIRHLSPAGGWYVRRFLDWMQPELVLIEGPSDFSELMKDLGSDQVMLPAAIMAYTTEPPMQTILCPFAVYSPEYQAIRWALEHKCPCRFCDLPSEVFLGIENGRQLRRMAGQSAGEDGARVTKQDGGESCGAREYQGNRAAQVYRKLDELSGEEDHEVFWERTLEQAADDEGYRRGSAEFGRSLRELSFGRTEDDAENLIREAYMRRVIGEAVQAGVAPEKIAVVTGAFHVEGILNGGEPMSDGEFAVLPRREAKKTLMPYSYYRLTERSGYGAGNKAPAYYELLWDSMCRGQADYAAHRYFAGIAEYQRRQGNIVSSAEIIEAVRLAAALADLHGGRIPTLRDLRDAAVTCMGHGKLSEIAQAVADAEIGTKIGSLPEGVSRTSIQSDFYRNLEELRLEKYKSAAAQELQLDLREKLTVKSKKAAFADLERSFFLHRLRVLGIRFAALQNVKQERATWAERWVLQWTPEAEIQIVEAVLKGDTVEQAASFELKERTEAGRGIGGLAQVIEDACLCGMPTAFTYAVDALQSMAVDAVSVSEIAGTAGRLSMVLRYGDIRRLNREPLVPILSQLFLRACLVLAGECVCDDQAAGQTARAMETLHEVSVSHDFLDGERWIRVLEEIAGRDDLNTRLSGLAAAILLEAGEMDSGELGREVERRLSKGIPAELGAGWFEGLSMKNHYALIARLTLWEKLSGYLDTLDDEEFKRALVFLRRAFADFSSEEKNQIAENLGEIWQVNPSQVSEVLNGTATQEELELLEGLDDFDFGDI